MKDENFEPYEVEGAVGGAVGSVIMLIVGVGVSVLILIFVGSLGGQTYNLVESDIDTITNTTVKNHVKNIPATTVLPICLEPTTMLFLPF